MKATIYDLVPGKKRSITTSELIDMLNELAEADVAEGSDVTDHTAYLAATQLIALEELQREFVEQDRTIIVLRQEIERLERK